MTRDIGIRLKAILGIILKQSSVTAFVRNVQKNIIQIWPSMVLNELKDSYPILKYSEMEFLKYTD